MLIFGDIVLKFERVSHLSEETKIMPVVKRVQE